MLAFQPEQRRTLHTGAERQSSEGLRLTTEVPEHLYHVTVRHVPIAPGRTHRRINFEQRITVKQLRLTTTEAHERTQRRIVARTRRFRRTALHEPRSNSRPG